MTETTKRSALWTALPLLLLPSFGCLEDDSESTDSEATEEAEQGHSSTPTPTAKPVLLTLVRSSSADYSARILQDPQEFDKYRESLILTVLVASQAGASLQLQLDENVAMAVDRFDSAPEHHSPWTGGVNVLAWAQDAMGVQIGARTTGSQFNHADIAFLLKRVGVTANVVSGLPVLGCDAEVVKVGDFVDGFGEGQSGQVYPSFQFQPQILHGLSGGESGAEEYSSGVWRPMDASKFFDTSAAGPLVYIGQGVPHADFLVPRLGELSPRATIEYLRGLGEAAAASPRGALVTASIEVPDVSEDVYAEAERLADLLQEIQPLVDNRRVQHASLGRIHQRFVEGGGGYRVAPEATPGQSELVEQAATVCKE